MQKFKVLYKVGITKDYMDVTGRNMSSALITAINRLAGVFGGGVEILSIEVDN